MTNVFCSVSKKLLIYFNFFSLTALQRGNVDSSASIIAGLDKLSADVKIQNLRAMMKNVSACFGTLSNALSTTFEIVDAWLQENREAVCGEPNFFHLLALTKREKQCKDWFKRELEEDAHGECKDCN